MLSKAKVEFIQYNVLVFLIFIFLPSGFLLTAAVSPSNKVIEEAYDVAALDKWLDYVSVMAYDYNGHWDKKTGHIAPLYMHPTADTDPTLNIVRSIFENGPADYSMMISLSYFRTTPFTS